ncbi:MAG TPA: hypothetical protein VEY91_02440 [Candidatus Limnocylindria bacterium]|nr:hypothetical protein [Candidatus Limnocylindria bacterium]
MDTITTIPGRDPVPVTIPVRFHMHWAGSDPDGEIAGFYYAVVETLPTPDPITNVVPPLPGPKPQDYRFTTRTDSIFIFTVAENFPDRQHAFYIYAVDNQGKPDPTPARFIFNANDRFPPVPIFDEAYAIGTIYVFDPGTGGVTPQIQRYDIRDSLVPGQFGIPPKDTVPSGSELHFRWHAEPTIQGSVVTGFRYKLDEPQLVVVDASVTSKSYGLPGEPDPLPGTKLFLLRAVDQANGTRDATRRFELNFSPDTWFSGPDVSRCTNCGTHAATGERFVVGGNGIDGIDGIGRPGGIGMAGSYLSPDSLEKLPAVRPQIRTFIEIYNDTAWVRSEGDTVHNNSWVILHMGGLDKDSPYTAIVSDRSEFLIPGRPVTTPTGPNGSPVGFRSQIVTRIAPTGSISIPLQSGRYPIWDPASNFDNPHVGGYHAMFQTGEAFALARAEDGDNALDNRIRDPRILVENVRNNTATEQERSLRSRVLTYHVNRSPFFVTSNPLFQPHPTLVDTFTTNQWHMEIYADDIDPFRPGDAVGKPSPPSFPKTLRRRITIHGLDTAGDSLRFTDGQSYFDPQFEFFIPPEVQARLRPGRVIVDIELADCVRCDDSNGGRIVNLQIPVEYRPPGAGLSTESSRPGSRGWSSRSERR